MSDIVERLRSYASDDHERLCQGREYSCTCGYDEKRDPLLAEAAAEIKRLRAALEWINQQRYTDRNTISPDNAFEHVISLNEKLIAVMDIARAALAQEKQDD
jgi:hypothetical protein